MCPGRNCTRPRRSFLMSRAGTNASSPGFVAATSCCALRIFAAPAASFCLSALFTLAPDDLHTWARTAHETAHALFLRTDRHVVAGGSSLAPRIQLTLEQRCFNRL